MAVIILTLRIRSRDIHDSNGYRITGTHYYGSVLTFLRCITVGGISLVHVYLHFGHVCRAFQYRCMIDCNMDANGVTPMPVAIITACWALNMWLDGAPYGPTK